MTSPVWLNGPAKFGSELPVSFTVTNGTVAKVLMEPKTGALASGSNPQFYGGSTALNISVASTDAVAKSVILWNGKIVTTQSVAATGVLSITGQNVLNRVSGSWIADGLLVGSKIMLFTPRGTAQAATGIDGIAVIVTAVTALALTVNGTPFANSAGLTAGTRVAVVAQNFRVAVPANSGNADGVANVSLINNSADKSAVRTEMKLDEDELLIVGMAAAVSALPATIDVCVDQYARY